MGGEDGAVLHIENLWRWFRGGPEREGGWERKTYEGRFTRMIDVQQVRIEIQMCVCICLDSGISSFWGIGTWWKVLGLWSVTTQGLYPERSCIDGGGIPFLQKQQKEEGKPWRWIWWYIHFHLRRRLLLGCVGEKVETKRV